jgi:ankyrin repeat protein
MNNIKTYKDSLNEAESQEVLNMGLFDAVVRGQEYAARLLLDRRAEVDARYHKGYTPLHLAATNGHVDISRLLLDRGADPDARDENDQTPLHRAATNGRTDTARLLILRGANPSKAFEDLQKIIKFFSGDIDWMPEGDLKTKLKRMQRGKQAFGM